MMQPWRMSVLPAVVLLAAMHVPCAGLRLEPPAGSPGDGSGVMAGDDGSGAGLAEETELWVFGISAGSGLARPLGAQGIRSIINLRTSELESGRRLLRQYSERGLGISLCLRWTNPAYQSGAPGGPGVPKNSDTPPTPAEARRAIEALVKLVKSDEARAIKGDFYIQFYNEIGGGPGRFDPKDKDEMFAFATKAAAEIRKANPSVKICGPALTVGQFLTREKPRAGGRNRTQRLNEKADLLRTAVQWSAEHADAIDLHIHGVDGSWCKDGIRALRETLDRYEGGKTTDIVCGEWSCARFKDRENPQAVRAAILGIWQVISAAGFPYAAYGPYWPLSKKPNAKINDMFGWASVVNSRGKPNPVVYNTLKEIGAAQAGTKKSGPSSQPDRPRRTRGRRRGGG